MSFPLRKLGRTGLEVTELGFGTAPVGNVFRPLSTTWRAPRWPRPKLPASAIMTPRHSIASACRSGGSATPFAAGSPGAFDQGGAAAETGAGAGG